MIIYRRMYVVLELLTILGIIVFWKVVICRELINNVPYGFEMNE